MKNKVLLVAFLAFTLFLFGCGEDKNNENNKQDDGAVVFQFGDFRVTKGEVYIYANTVKESYQEKYGKDIWELKPDSTTEGKTVEELTREAIIEEIIRVKLFSSHADEYNVRLSETDEKDISDKAHEFYSKLTDKDIREMEITEELALMVIRENLLETRVKEAVLTAEPVEISDEKARMTCFYDMYFPCFSVNESGYVKPYTDEEKEEQHKRAVEACSQLATAELGENTDAQSIEKLAEIYELTEAKERTLSPDEIKETYGEDIFNEIYKMKDGQYSTVLESEYGYHIFQMIELTAKEATAEKKSVMTTEAVEKLIKDKEQKWKSEVDDKFSYPDSVDMEKYNEIEIK